MSRPHVAIVGGGLAGLAAAVALCDSSFDVTLFESRRQLGGRAASFRDPATGALVDFCQHVSMGCCTNLTDFCRRTGIDNAFDRVRTLHFVAPDGQVTNFTSKRWLPAPLHLAPALLRLKYISVRDRWRVARALVNLARAIPDVAAEPTFAVWLAEQGQSPSAIERFWSVVVVSALGDTLDRVSTSAARKVFVDGFMANRTSYEVLIPKQPLSELFNGKVGEFLRMHGVSVRVNQGVSGIAQSAPESFELVNGAASLGQFQNVIFTVPWRVVGDVLDANLRRRLPWLELVEQFDSSPITGIHLWFDRSITQLPHAVLIGRLGQWLFRRGPQTTSDGELHYYQVVISASRELANVRREEIPQQIHRELAEIWPAAAQARLVASRVVTEQHAVFCVKPGLDALRPDQRTAVPGLFVAGDWTNTGWPATMEGAVRSGYLAAERLVNTTGRPRRILVADAPMSWLTRLLAGRPACDSPSAAAPAARTEPI